MAGATEAAGKGKTIQKVALSILDSLTKPLNDISVDLAEGLIERACDHKALLSKYFTNSWNRGYL